MDTGKDATGQVMYKGNSTVSRYACRIICERKPPYTARLYAGAFDTNNRIKPLVSRTFILSHMVLLCGSPPSHKVRLLIVTITFL